GARLSSYPSFPAIYTVLQMSGVLGFVRISGVGIPIPGVAAFLRKVRCGFDEVPTAVHEAIGGVTSSSRGRLRDKASHIWMDRGNSLARFANTPARFSPACLRPERTALRKTDPTLRQSGTLSPSRRSHSGNPPARAPPRSAFALSRQSSAFAPKCSAQRRDV